MSPLSHSFSFTLTHLCPQHPGNVAVDPENGGRLIYYDFGMMGSLAPEVKSGLLELFYGGTGENSVNGMTGS